MVALSEGECRAVLQKRCSSGPEAGRSLARGQAQGSVPRLQQRLRALRFVVETNQLIRSNGSIDGNGGIRAATSSADDNGDNGGNELA